VAAVAPSRLATNQYVSLIASCSTTWTQSSTPLPLPELLPLLLLLRRRRHLFTLIASGRHSAAGKNESTPCVAVAKGRRTTLSARI